VYKIELFVAQHEMPSTVSTKLHLADTATHYSATNLLHQDALKQTAITTLKEQFYSRLSKVAIAKYQGHI